MKIGIAALVLVAGFVTPARPAAIVAGIWYEFQFLDSNTAAFGCTATTCVMSTAPNTSFAGDPPWTFTSATPVQFILTDAFLAGDNFELFNNGQSLGITPATNGFADCGDDPVACSMNPMVSHRIYNVPAGNDSFTINVLSSSAGAGTGFFMMPVPEPADWLLMSFAFLALMVWRRGIIRSSVAMRGALLFAAACLARSQSVTLVDPWSSLFANGGITTDVDALATQGIPRTGVATDGATPMVVRFSASIPATVCFSITDAGGQPLSNPDEDGALSPLAGAPGVCGFSTFSTVSGQNAFALYTAPSTFIRSGSPGDVNLPERTVFLTTAYTVGGQQNMLPPLPIRIVRPPVVLVHGLWGDADDMRPLLINLLGPVQFKLGPKIGGCYDSPTTGYFFCVVDYKNQNAEAFQTAAGVVLSQFRNILLQFRVQKGVGAKQVQVVAHSMGGVVTRTTALCGFPLLCNAGAGVLFYNSEVMRMITIGTPHQGSALANFLAPNRGAPCVFGTTRLGDALAKRDLPLGPAIDDLMVNSPAIQTLNEQPTPFPQYFIVGIAAANDEQLFNRMPANNQPGGVLGIIRSLCTFVQPVPASVQSIFNGIKSDLIVSVYSQRLGLRDMAPGTKDIMPLIHTNALTLGVAGYAPDEKSSPDVANTVIQTLNQMPAPFIIR